jgi:hypothetical protein
MTFTVPLEEIWIVQASSGRHSGSAYVRATSKKEANHLAQACNWLMYGRVIKSQTMPIMKWYEINEGITEVADLISNFISEQDVVSINNLTEVGKWHEIEWGC